MASAKSTNDRINHNNHSNSYLTDGELASFSLYTLSLSEIFSLHVFVFSEIIMFMIQLGL